jgi:hypothetical protein
MTAASTHPPFDPELSATLAVLPPELQHPLLLEDIPAWREQIGLLPGGDELLLRDGAVGLEERQVPGPEGAPDLSVLILRPARGSGGRGQAAGVRPLRPGPPDRISHAAGLPPPRNPRFRDRGPKPIK